MTNPETFVLSSSYINSNTVYLNWVLSYLSPVDTIDTDTFYITYINQSNMETTILNVGSLMNYSLQLSSSTEYHIFIYSINTSFEQSENSNTLVIRTGDIINTYSASAAGVRPYGFPKDSNDVTIEDLTNIVTVSSSTTGLINPESTFVTIVNSSSPKPFYQLYRIDPKGDLFGNTPCGYFNFKKRVTKL
jgi:hypothetical protein